MADVKLEDLPDLVLAATTLLYGENTPFTALADAGKIPLSLMDTRNAALYLLLTGGTMAGNIEMGGNFINNVGQITFNLANGASVGIGELQWNNDDGTLEVGALGGTVILQIGQENHAYIVQKTGSTIPNGKAVTVIGASGERMQVALTNLAAGPPLDIAGGITTESIDNNQQGYATTFGLVRNIDTSAWAEGAFLWADGVTPGDLTDTRPIAPLRAMFIGTVVRSHASLGSIFVFPIVVPNLSLLSDVFAPSVADGDFLRWVAANSRWEATTALPQVRSVTVTTQGLGSNPDIFAFGFYEFNTTDVTLTQASLTQTFGTATVTHASHAFAVFGGAGTVDTGVIGLRVNGTSINDQGTRATGDTETLSSDITTLNLNDYLETTKKWLGQVTYELFTVSGLPTAYSLDFNYGLAKYDDWFNRDFTITSVEAAGLGGATDTSFDVILLHHETSDWIYAATGFTPITAGHIMASLATDHVTDDQLRNGQHFAWKRDNLAQVIVGSGSEGFMVCVTSSANNAVEYCNIHVGATVV